jgi:hypothetical protein
MYWQHRRRGHLPRRSILTSKRRTVKVPWFSRRSPHHRHTNNKGGNRMIVILRRPNLSDILLAFVPA